MRRVCVVLAVCALAGCGSSAQPISAPSLHRSPPIVMIAPPSSVPASPPQSDDFDGPGQFYATWRGVKVAATPCPAADPTAACYRVTGTASLSIIGAVALTRTDIVGTGTASPPVGCVDASTTGTLANVTGVLTFVASGELCGRRTSFTVSSSSATGSMARYVLHAVIINDATISDAVTETWSGEISAN